MQIGHMNHSIETSAEIELDTNIEFLDETEDSIEDSNKDDWYHQGFSEGY